MPILIASVMTDICDRCGKDVPPDNDMRTFDVYLTGNPMCMFESTTRHVLPVINDGTVTCPGSPSRAQYIEGQPRDPRPEYTYNPASESAYREAWQKLQDSQPVETV